MLCNVLLKGNLWLLSIAQVCLWKCCIRSLLGRMCPRKMENQSVLRGEQGTWFSQSPLLSNIKWGLLSSCHTGIAISGSWGRRIKNEITFTCGHRGPWCSTTQAIPLGLDENQTNDTALRRNVWENVCFIWLRSFLIIAVHGSFCTLIKLHMWISSRFLFVVQYRFID